MKYERYCPYCFKGDAKPLNTETIKYSGIELRLVGKATVLRARSMDEDGELYDKQECVLINYCPMCGRQVR